MKAAAKRAALAPPRDPALVRLALGVCDRLRFVYGALGVDYRAFRSLLRAKLVLDQRRTPASDGAPRFAQRASFAAMLGVYLLVSAFLGAAALRAEDPFAYVTLVQAVAMGLLALPLFADFSSVLLDTTDLKVLGALPISDRTLLAVRLTHVAFYVGLILAALEVGPLVAGAARFAPHVYVPLMIASALLAGSLTVCLVVLFYLIALRALPVARLRDCMVYVQVGAIVVFYVGMQLVGHVLAWLPIDEWIAERPLALALFPPAAYGGLMRLALGAARPIDPWLAVEAFALPAAALALVVLLSRRGFLSSLAAMENARGGAPPRRRRYGATGRVSRRILRDPLARAGSAFFLGLCASERGFRLRALPQCVMLVVPFAMLVLRPGRGRAELVESGPSLALVLGLVPYVLLFLALGMWEHARFSDWPSARWCLDGLERDERARFVRGSLAAVVLRFVALPSALLLAAAPFVAGARGFASVAHASGIALAVALLTLPLAARELPFAEAHSPGRAQSNVGFSIVTSIFVGLLGLAHYGVGRLPHGHAAAALLALPLVAVALLRFRSAPLRLRYPSSRSQAPMRA